MYVKIIQLRPSVKHQSTNRFVLVSLFSNIWQVLWGKLSTVQYFEGSEFFRHGQMPRLKPWSQRWEFAPVSSHKWLDTDFPPTQIIDRNTVDALKFPPLFPNTGNVKESRLVDRLVLKQQLKHGKTTRFNWHPYL
jgi:hypothetical protein